MRYCQRKIADSRIGLLEMASFFGIQTWFYKNVTELSGGQWGAMTDLNCLSSVVFPHPEGPQSTKNSPCSIVKERLRIAGSGCSG